VIAAANALEECRRLLWKSTDRFVDITKANAQAVTHGEEFAARSAPQGFDFQDSQTRQEAARTAFQRQVSKELRDSVQVEFHEEATKIGAQCALAMSTLSDAIDAAKAEWLGPSALRSTAKTDIESLLKEQRLIVQVRVLGAKGIEEIYSQALKVGDGAKQEAIEDASTAYLKEIVEAPRSKLAGRDNFRTGEADKEKGLAMKLMAMFAQAKLERMPESVSLAANCLEGLRAIFRELCGTNVRFLGREEFSRRYLSGIEARTDPFDVDSSWIVRRLPPSPIAGPPPGWTPIAGNTLDGSPYRLAPKA
jgi:hypothetical protein